MKKIKFILLLIAGLAFACADEKPKNSKPVPPKKETNKSPTAKTVANENDQSAQGPTVPPEQIKKAKEIIASVSREEIEAVDAKKIYKMRCAACHGFQGDSNINGAKDLTKSRLPSEESLAQVYFGKGLMTPFKGILDDVEIVAVSKYIEKELRK